MELFSSGDAIRIVNDIGKVHQLQENHGGWVDDMALVGGRLLVCTLCVNFYIEVQSVVKSETGAVQINKIFSLHQH